VKPAQLQEEDQLFQLYASYSKFDHLRYLNNHGTNPLHGPFRPVPPRSSYISASLDRVIPKSLWAAGLRDWDTDALKKVWDADKFFVDERVQKKLEDNRPTIMMGIKAFEEEREEKRKKEEERLREEGEYKNKQLEETGVD